MLNVDREALAVESIEAGGPREAVPTLHFTVVTLGSQRAKTMSSCQPPPPRDLSLDPPFAAAPTLPGLAVRAAEADWKSGHPVSRLFKLSGNKSSWLGRVPEDRSIPQASQG